MSSLLVVTGPPGAGKSTVSELLVERFEPSVLVQGDAFFGFLRRGAIAPWLPESHEQNLVVTEAAARTAGRFATGRFTVVFDGVVGPWFLPTFAAATGLDHLDYVILLPPVDTCVERLTTRQNHGFDDEAATRRMHRQFATATVDARHRLVDPSGAPSEVADQIADAVAAGSLACSLPPMSETAVTHGG